MKFNKNKFVRSRLDQNENKGLLMQSIGQAYLLNIMIELSPHFSALIFPVYIVKHSVSYSLPIMVLGLVFGYYIYLFLLTFGVGLLIRVLPKPTNGLIESKHEMDKFCLLISLMYFLLRSPARSLFYLLPFPGYYFYQLCGSKISSSMHLSDPDQLHDPYLISIGHRTVVGVGSIISGHYNPKSGVIMIGRVKIGNDVIIGRGSSVWCNVEIGDGAIIQELSSVAPGTVIPAGEIWGGVPAKKLFSWMSKESEQSRDIHRIVNEQNIRKSIKQYFKTMRNIELNSDDFSHPVMPSGLLDSLSILDLCQYLENEYKISETMKKFVIYQSSLSDLVDEIFRDNYPSTDKSTAVI